MLSFAACNRTPKFNVKGEIDGADGKTLYLEASTIEGVQALDSVTMKGNRAMYHFKQAQPECPEFYRLRIGDEIINFSIDSTETVVINAPLEGFSVDYTVQGSENTEKIKELTLKQMKLQEQANKLLADVRANKLMPSVYEDSIESLIDNYKNDVKNNYIYKEPYKAYAYFALFQKLDNYMIFDPMNSRDDVKTFAAVATSLNNTYPHADRSKNLYNIVIKGMRNTRLGQKTIEIPRDSIPETGIINIALRDQRGREHKLSDLKGKIVLLDFTIYQSAVSATHNYQLNQVYEKYKAQGLEIYQVSLDADEHFWKTTANNLPWICVRDPNGVYSSYITAYNIQRLPEVFLIDRKNEIRLRDEAIKDIDAAIKSVL